MVQVRLKQPSVGKRALLKDHELFGQLSLKHLDRLSACVNRQTVKRGKRIFASGDQGISLFAITKGTVKISILSSDGREAVLSFLGRGNIFGEIALLDGGPRTADALAITDCDLYVIERRNFLTLMRNEPEIALRFIEILCARLRKMTTQAHDIMFLTLPGRLANALLRLSEPGQVPTERIVRSTQTALANMIGMSREATNKQLRIWERNKWIRMESRGLIVFRVSEIGRISDRPDDIG